MRRYFFDVKMRTCVEHDFTGRLLSTSDEVLQFAEMIAADLACLRSNEGNSAEVQVRSPEGLLLLAIPIEPIREVFESDESDVIPCWALDSRWSAPCGPPSIVARPPQQPALSERSD